MNFQSKFIEIIYLTIMSPVLMLGMLRYPISRHVTATTIKNTGATIKPPVISAQLELQAKINHEKITKTVRSTMDTNNAAAWTNAQLQKQRIEEPTQIRSNYPDNLAAQQQAPTKKLFSGYGGVAGLLKATRINLINVAQLNGTHDQVPPEYSPVMGLIFSDWGITQQFYELSAKVQASELKEVLDKNPHAAIENPELANYAKELIDQKMMLLKI